MLTLAICYKATSQLRDVISGTWAALPSLRAELSERLSESAAGRRSGAHRRALVPRTPGAAEIVHQALREKCPSDMETSPDESGGNARGAS